MITPGPEQATRTPALDDSTMKNVLRHLQNMASAGQLVSIEPLLPLLLNLKGKPYTLKDHYHFAPLFRLTRPQRVIYKCGRQVGKSVGFGADMCTLAASIAHFALLYIAPLYEQARRFSTLTMRPFIQESPVRDLWIGTSVEQSVLQRTFKNGSRMLFSFALTDADRVRGLSMNGCVFDEIQDMDKDLLPVIIETMAADRVYGLERYACTPKTTDSASEYIWQQSSQAEWWIPCQHCTTNGKPTWNIPALEYHLEAMLGPLHDGISTECPAIICYKCRKPLYSRMGRWVHRFPDRRWLFDGYHIPQPIIPLHYDNPRKWADLLRKRERSMPAMFCNEVLGESKDMGQKLVSRQELIAACRLPWPNVPDHPRPEVMARLGTYRSRVLAIDWGGGGESGLSLTVMALVCMRPDGIIEVPWAKKTFGTDHLADAAEAVKWFNLFRCQMLAHDYTGAGVVRDTILTQAGLPLSQNMPIQYVAASRQDLLVKVPAAFGHRREHYRVDKTRSLHFTVASIRLGKLVFYEYDYKGDDDPGLVDHFLRLIEDRTSLELTGSFYRIVSNGMGPDDFAQAINIGCVCTWEINDAYPNFADAAHLQITPDVASMIGDDGSDWEIERESRFRGNEGY